MADPFICPTSASSAFVTMLEKLKHQPSDRDTLDSSRRTRCQKAHLVGFSWLRAIGEIKMR